MRSTIGGSYLARIRQIIHAQAELGEYPLPIGEAKSPMGGVFDNQDSYFVHPADMWLIDGKPKGKRRQYDSAPTGS